MSKPGTLGLYGGVTKFDELQSAHVLSTGVTHRVVCSTVSPWA